MTIFYIANARIPTEKAHGIQIMKMCEAFAKLGHEVKLLVPRRVSHITDEAFAFYGIQPRFEIVYLSSIDFVRWSGFVPKVFAYLQNWSFARSMKKYLAIHSADIIYTRDELSVEKIPDRFKTILEAHNVSRILKKQASELDKKLYKLVCITKALKRALVKFGFAEQKIMVLPDGVDLAQFQISISKLQIREELRLSKDKKIILYSGNFFAWKGVYVLAEAAREFDDDFLFVFVGGSPDEEEKFREYLAAHKLATNIKLIGHVSYNQVPKYLAAADVLVLPNSEKSDISKYYTSPLKLFEYMAAGQPIVASDLPSIREILNESNAILVKPDDPPALALGIRQALANLKIVEKARQDVPKYSWAKRAESIINIL